MAGLARQQGEAAQGDEHDRQPDHDVAGRQARHPPAIVDRAGRVAHQVFADGIQVHVSAKVFHT